MTPEQAKELRKDHPLSLEGIKKAYPWEKIISSYPFITGFVLSFVLILATVWYKKDLYQVVTFWTEQIVAIFPNILGFNLGGYALIVGFGNTNLIKSLTKKLPDEDSSVFQQLSGIFAFTLILEAYTFLSAFIINFIIKQKFQVSQELAVIINGMGCFFLAFLSIWGILILPSLVVNVFTFGQLHHFSLRKEIIKEQEFKIEAEKNSKEIGFKQDGQQ